MRDRGLGFGFRFRAVIVSVCAALGASASPSAAEDFYEATAADLQGPPGSVIRYLGIPRIQLTGAMVYRVLYRSTGLNGQPIAVSGIVMAPDRKAPAGGWPVIAWAHGTTGVARKCAPSLLPDPIASIPGINEMILHNFVVAATDYPGLGTAGEHPYLIGESEGRAVLDSVRAARAIPEAGGGERFAVWGHSQGGHASLWTGELAAKYAPELKLVGVAAAAPASELGPLFKDDINSTAGKILTGMVLWSWSKLFGYPLEQMVAPSEIPAVTKIGTECVDLLGYALEEVSAEGSLPHKFLQADPTKTQPWEKTIAANTPGRSPAGAPVYISQGTADKVVDPAVTDNFVRLLCGQGAHVTYVKYPNLSHTEVAKASAKQAVEWMTDRFAGKAVPSNCGG